MQCLVFRYLIINLLTVLLYVKMLIIVYFVTVDQQIQLVGGTVFTEGRVEVRKGCHSDWGTVCDDYWGTADAQVACRQLGYETNRAVAYRSARFGQGSGDVLLDDLACTGRETSLFQCRHNDIPDCSHSEDASVSCPRKQTMCNSVHTCKC